MSATAISPAPALALRARSLDAYGWAAAATTVLGAALRFSTLGVQSLWKDEAVTVVRILHPSLPQTIATIPHSEATPPLYYILAWAWTRVLGTSEVGIRSLSALAGTVTIPLVYIAASRLASRRAGVFAAALAACNPYLIWYSQEARAYALLAMLCALSFVLFLRARGGRSLAWWAVVSALALATHYFAVFTVAPEAIWLLVSWRRRGTYLAVGAVGIAGIALLPLALHQASLGHDGWIAAISLPTRVTDTARYFLAAPTTEPSALVTLLAGTIVLGIVWLAVIEREDRAGLLVAGGIGLASIAIPLVLALGYDFFFHRNLIGALPLLIVAAGIACASRRVRVTGPLLAAALCAVSLVAVMQIDTEPRMQRADWRSAARAIGPARGPRAIVTPSLGDEPLEYYLGHLTLLHHGTRVAEVDLLGWPAPHAAVAPPPPGFRPAGRRRVGAFTLVRYRASTALPVERAALAADRLGSDHPGVLVATPH